MSDQPRKKVTISVVPKLSLNEAADYCGLSRRGFQKHHYRDAGPPFFRLGKKLFFDIRDLDSWLEAHRVDPERERQAASV